MGFYGSFVHDAVLQVRKSLGLIDERKESMLAIVHVARRDGLGEMIDLVVDDPEELYIRVDALICLVSRRGRVELGLRDVDQHQSRYRLEHSDLVRFEVLQELAGINKFGHCAPHPGRARQRPDASRRTSSTIFPSRSSTSVRLCR